MSGKLTRLATVDKVDMKTPGKTDLFVVPSNAKLVIAHFSIREPSASLAGGDDYDFGDADASNWYAETVDLSALTGSGDVRKLEASTAPVFGPGVTISIVVATGSTLASNAAIDLIGYLLT